MSNKPKELYDEYHGISKTKRELFNSISISIYYIRKLYYKLATKRSTTFDFEDAYSSILNTEKRKDNENKGQWGYYLSQDIEKFLFIIDKLKTKSIVDLGSGPGLLLKAILLYNHKIKVKGYEIEDVFIEDSQLLDLQNQIFKQDILQLETKDIINCDTIFFYEPVADPKLAKQFVNNLSKIVIKGQWIIYNRAGYIGDNLDKNKRFKQYYSLNSYRVYKVIN